MGTPNPPPLPGVAWGVIQNCPKENKLNKTFGLPLAGQKKTIFKNKDLKKIKIKNNTTEIIKKVD